MFLSFNGYNGKLAHIDLTEEKVKISDLRREDALNYIGGCGLSAKFMYDSITESSYEILKKNPFDEINPIIFATGPLTATQRPSSGRYSVASISPLTGIWGEATSGGQFPAALKYSGFDAIIITGKSNAPIYIVINNGKIEFKEAKHLWGKNTYDTQDLIKKELNDRRVRVTCIGKAGENLVKYACIINDEGRAAGRSGMGAILGSKNCKALAITGTSKIELYDKNSLSSLSEEAVKTIRKAFSANFFEQFGTLCYMDVGQVFGDTPGYYFTDTEFMSSGLTGRGLKEQFPVINAYCYGCSIGCGRTTYLEEEGKDVKIDGPEYETVAAYGPLIGNSDMRYILRMNHLSNEEGVDTISAGVSIAFLIYLVENKLALDKIESYLTDIELEEIKWGNKVIAFKLLEKTINKKDIGSLLSEGTRKMAQILNVDPNLAANVKGLEIPMHDPRAYVAQGLSYMTSCVGANHNKADYFNIDGDAVSFPTLKLKRRDRFEIKRKEKLVAILQDIRAIDDSAITCNFVTLPIELTIKIFNAITGFNYDEDHLLMCGERINTLKRLINCKLGVTRKDDDLPGIIKKPLNSGSTKGVSLNLEENLKKYYEYREWDWETGFPLKSKLEALGIK